MLPGRRKRRIDALRANDESTRSAADVVEGIARDEHERGDRRGIAHPHVARIDDKGFTDHVVEPPRGRLDVEQIVGTDVPQRTKERVNVTQAA
jgi:hypothetical protein